MIEADASVRLRVNAKVNLFLGVLGKRSDGYHDIETVFHTIGLADDIRIEVSPAPHADISLTLSGAAAGVPYGEENLAVRAAAALLRAAGEEARVRISLQKQIPSGAGLGGGSADAAGVLVGLNHLSGGRLDSPALRDLGRALGADVPFCMEGGTALGTGRGDELRAIPPPPQMSFVLGLASAPLLTRDVYGRVEPSHAGAVPVEEMLEALEDGDPAWIGARLHNDLEPAAFALRPELAAAKALLLEAGTLGASLCGSGPAVFGIAAGEGHAQAVAEEVAESFAAVLVVTSRPSAIEGVS